MGAFYRYTIDRKLKAGEWRDYSVRAPICQIDGFRMQRVAVRGFDRPWPWLPVGWICTDCGLIDLELL